MKKKQNKYRVRNWSDYNAGLEKRGSISFWIDEEVIAQWQNENKTGKRGASNYYNDIAIETVVVIKSIYQLAGRQAVGFVKSVMALMKVNLKVPDHSTVSRRLAKIDIDLPIRKVKEARHVVIDSTGIKIFGEGEWKTRKHGASKRRTWRKVHIAFDEATSEILALEVTLNDKSDGQMLPDLLDAIEGEIEQVSADGGYDHSHCYDAIRERKAKVAIPPRKNAVIWQHGNCKAEPHPRDENLRYIRRKSYSNWKVISNYHRRSISETGMFRFKTTFGSEAFSHTFDNQVAEVKIKAKVLNKMIHIAKPDSQAIPI